MKIPFTICLFFISIAAGTAQTALPYYTSFESATDTSGWEQYRLGAAADPFYLWYYFDGHLNHDYPVGGSGLTDDWMVSPPFDFSNGGMIDSLRFRGEGFGVPMNMDTVALYLITGSQNPDLASSQVLLKLFSDSSYMNDDVWYGHYNIQIPATPGTSYLAFRYQTESNWLDVSVDDLSVSDNPVGIEEKELESIRIFPNPAVDYISWLNGPASSPADVSIFDQQGNLAINKQTFDGKVDVSSLSSGIYFIKIQSNGIRFSKRLVIF